MADNTTLNSGSGGDVIATDDISGVKHQQVKVEFGIDGTATPVSASDPLPVTAASLPLPSGAATAAKQPALGTAGVSSADVISVQGIASGTALPISGTVTANAGSGTLAVSLATLPALVAGTANIGDVDIVTVPAPLSTTGGGTEATALRVTLASDSTGLVSVDDNAGSLTVDAPVATPVNVQIGNGTLSAGVIDETGASAVDALAVGGGTAHDAVDSGNPIKLGAKVETSPKGITLAADGDRTNLYADADGILITKLNTANADLISERIADTVGTSTAFTNFSAVASTYNYVTAISLSNSSASAAYVDFRNGTGGAVLWTMLVPAGGGSNISCSTPLFKTSANTALAYDVSAATTTMYINVSGFQSKA